MIQSVRIQLHKHSATFDKLNAMEEEQLILKQHEVLFKRRFRHRRCFHSVGSSRNKGKAMYCLLAGMVNTSSFLISHKQTSFYKRPVRRLCYSLFVFQFQRRMLNKPGVFLFEGWRSIIYIASIKGSSFFCLFYFCCVVISPQPA